MALRTEKTFLPSFINFFFSEIWLSVKLHSDIIWGNTSCRVSSAEQRATWTWENLSNGLATGGSSSCTLSHLQTPAQTGCVSLAGRFIIQASNLLDLLPGWFRIKPLSGRSPHAINPAGSALGLFYLFIFFIYGFAWTTIHKSLKNAFSFSCLLFFWFWICNPLGTVHINAFITWLRLQKYSPSQTRKNFVLFSFHRIPLVSSRSQNVMVSEGAMFSQLV